MIIRTARRLALVALGTLASTGLAQSLTMAVSTQPETLDPQITAATSSFQATKSIYDTLVEPNRDGEIVPSLASDWSVSDDGTTWTFTLEEATFHDGTSFDADDVVATFDRIRAEETASPNASEFAAITALEAPDDRTAVVHLEEPRPALLGALASGWGAILPAEKIEADHDFGNDPVGTGPFVFEEWVRDSHLELRRFDDYFAGAPEVEEVTLRFVGDTSVMLQGLLSGDFDIIDTVATADYQTVESDPDLVLERDPSGLVLVASLNNRRPYLEDPRVRRALNLAVDKETILDAAYGGGTPVGTFMEAGSPWLPDDVEAFPHDPEQARALLDEAGVPDDWTLDMALPQQYEAHVQAGQIIQAMLSDIDVDADIRMVEWGVWLGEIYGGPRDFDVTVIGHTGKLDPTGRLDDYGDPEANYVGYDDEEVVAWLDEARSATDPERRQQLYAHVLRRMHEEAPFLYIGTPDTIWARSADVEGFWITPALDTFDFRDVTLN